MRERTQEVENQRFIYSHSKFVMRLQRVVDSVVVAYNLGGCLG